MCLKLQGKSCNIIVQAMSYEIRDLPKEAWPKHLDEIPQTPKNLRIAGEMPAVGARLLAVVGARKETSYGRDVVKHIIEGLAGYPISIVSGLALGIDSTAHHAAMTSGLHTIAIPGSGLSPKCIYPRAHLGLAKKIIESGGALLSEYPDDTPAAPWTFPQRNRIMAGISHATLIVEASMKSGTLITARLALDYGREVFAVPGSIFSPNSEGPFYLMREGATPVKSADDILAALKIEARQSDVEVKTQNLTPDEERIVDLLKEKPMDKDSIIRALEADTAKTNAILTSLSIRGVVREEMGEFRVW